MGVMQLGSVLTVRIIKAGGVGEHDRRVSIVSDGPPDEPGSAWGRTTDNDVDRPRWVLVTLDKATGPDKGSRQKYIGRYQ